MLGSEIRFPLQKREEAERFFPLFVCRRMRGLGTSDLKTPLPGAGGVCKVSRNRSRAARVRVPFSAPRQKGESLGILLFCFCMPAHGGLGTCDLKTPLPWAGGDVSKKWRGALVLRLRILLSGRADGQSIESSSSAPLISFSLSCPFPCPVFRFRRLVVRGAGPGSDPASILQRTAFCLGVLRSLCGPGSRDYSSSENS